MKEIPVKIMAGFILVELSYENYSEVCDVLDIQTSLNKIYTDVMKIFLKNETILVNMLKVTKKKR